MVPTTLPQKFFEKSQPRPGNLEGIVGTTGEQDF